LTQNKKLLKYQHMDWKSSNIHEYDYQEGVNHLFSKLEKRFSKGISTLKFLNEMEKVDQPWILKEPRLCVTLKTWLPFLTNEYVSQFNHYQNENKKKISDKKTTKQWFIELMGLNPTKAKKSIIFKDLETLRPLPAIIFTFRHPLSVARSLTIRNNMPLKDGLNLWIDYNQLALENAKDLCVVFTNNDLLMMVGHHEINRIISNLITKCAMTNNKNILHPISKDDSSLFIHKEFQHSNQSNLISEIVRKSKKERRIKEGEEKSTNLVQNDLVCEWDEEKEEELRHVLIENQNSHKKKNNHLSLPISKDKDNIWKELKTVYKKAIKLYCSLIHQLDQDHS